MPHPPPSRNPPASDPGVPEASAPGHAGTPVENPLGLDLWARDGKALLRSGHDWLLVENDVAFFRRWIATKQRWGSAVLPAGQVVVPGPGTWRWVDRHMRHVIVNTTDRCNSACQVCFKRHCTEEDFSLTDLEESLSHLRRRKHILLSGGECTTRADLHLMLAAIRRAGHVPAICTNGLSLASASYLRHLRQAGLAQVYFSLDGFTPAIHQALRGDATQLERKLRALEELDRLGGIAVHLSALIVPGVNEDQIPRLIRFAARRTRFIRSLLFFQNNVVAGFYAAPTAQWTTSDILSQISTTWPFLDSEYWLGHERLLHNLEQLGQGVGIQLHLSSLGVLLRWRGDDLLPLLAREEIDALNRRLESGRGSALVAAIRLVARLGRHGLWPFPARLAPRHPRPGQGRDLLHLTIQRINAGAANLPLASDTVNIAKKRGTVVLRQACQ